MQLSTLSTILATVGLATASGFANMDDTIAAHSTITVPVDTSFVDQLRPTIPELRTTVLVLLKDNIVPVPPSPTPVQGIHAEVTHISDNTPYTNEEEESEEGGLGERQEEAMVPTNKALSTFLQMRQQQANSLRRTAVFVSVPTPAEPEPNSHHPHPVITPAPQQLHLLSRGRDWRVDRDKAISRGREAAARGRAKGRQGAEGGRRKAQDAQGRAVQRFAEEPEAAIGDSTIIRTTAGRCVGWGTGELGEFVCFLDRFVSERRCVKRGGWIRKRREGKPPAAIVYGYYWPVGQYAQLCYP
ncbi:hypothetical protein P885DRAFT_58088 [Corynascus similis CBS 632.67]